MATLPVSVERIVSLGADNYQVVLALADGTTAQYVLPMSLATIEGVTLSAVAVATLLDPDVTAVTGHHRGHRRYLPREG